MSFLFKLILVVIFVYLIYTLFLRRKRTSDPYSKQEDVQEPSKPEDETSVQKKIDMSEVEDADYKEIK